MSYTSVEQVKGHLAPMYPVADRIFDQRVVLYGTDYLPFYGSAVEIDSVVVKSLRSHECDRCTLTLTAEGAMFGSCAVVPGSVTVASDSSLGIVYTENEDYIIDYTIGRVTAKSGGSLEVGQTVTVWYLPFVLYTEGVDFRIDAEQGRLARATGGDIAEGEAVFVDYSPVHAGFDEEILILAVQYANGLVEREVDPEREFGADPVLSIVAAYRALEIVCRSAAARELSGLRGQDRVASTWMKLAFDYSGLADRLMKSYHPPCTGPAAPVR